MCSIFNKLCCHNVVSRAADVLRVVLPDAGAVGEARGGRGASGRPLEQLRGGLGGNACFTMVSWGAFPKALLLTLNLKWSNPTTF